MSMESALTFIERAFADDLAPMLDPARGTAERASAAVAWGHEIGLDFTASEYEATASLIADGSRTGELDEAALESIAGGRLGDRLRAAAQQAKSGARQFASAVKHAGNDIDEAHPGIGNTLGVVGEVVEFLGDVS